MKILAVDTATEACSAALGLDDDILQRYELAPREHTKLILPMIQSLLDEAGLSIQQLDAIAFGRGPGSFTGVRIATGVAQGLAYGADLPVLGISTLAAIAQAASEEQQAEQILAAIDARMGGVYWGAYCLADDGLVALQGKEQVTAPDQVPVPDAGTWTGAGSGWAAYGDLLEARLGDRLVCAHGDYLPRAASISRLAQAAFKRGEAVAPAQAMPVYLRNDVAVKTRDR